MKSLLATLFGVITLSCAFIYRQTNSGTPWHNQMQQIPGKIECELYNEGGEGLAYHDDDSVNNGSGKLNPANGTLLNEFRMKEGVDVSYTKAHDHIDDSSYNKVTRTMNQFYVGWTKPGEWINYTIKVNKTAHYKIGLLYTANGNGAISIDLDGKDATGPMQIPSTHDDRDTTQWRQWHHWNSSDSIGTINLTKGTHVLKLHIVANGNMNLDYLEFKEE